MKKLLLVCLVCCGLTSMACAGLETFESGAGDWQYGYGLGSVDGELVENGGNPDGYLSGSLNNLYKVWTNDPSTFGGITGETMTVDTKIDGSSEVSGKAQFFIGFDNTYYFSAEWNVPRDKKWTTHQSNISEFTLWDNGNDSPRKLDEVISSADEMGIFFGTKLAKGEGKYFMIDNFGFVPEPATLIFLGIGGMLSHFIR